MTVDDLKSILDRHDYTDVILTGVNLNPEVCRLADEIIELKNINSEDQG